MAIIGSAVMVKAESTFPLRMDMDVSTRRNTQNIGAGKDGQARVEQVSLRVRIRCSSGSPHTTPLKAEVDVIGRTSGNINVGGTYESFLVVVKARFRKPVPVA